MLQSVLSSFRCSMPFCILFSFAVFVPRLSSSFANARIIFLRTLALFFFTVSIPVLGGLPPTDSSFRLAKFLSNINQSHTVMEHLFRLNAIWTSCSRQRHHLAFRILFGHKEGGQSTRPNRRFVFYMLYNSF